MKRARWSPARRPHGLTLVELVIALVVFSVGVVALLAALASFGGRSGDPLQMVQGRAIAEAYMDEIIGKAFTDPGLDPLTGAACTAPNAGGRGTYDNICDYRGLPDGLVRDQNGALITGLGDYRVAVTISDNVSFHGIPAGDVLQVDVVVTDALGRRYRLTGIETRY